MASAIGALSLATQKVAEMIRDHRLLEPDDHVLVAFSGGADSTALTLLLSELGYRMVIGHVDHGMRPDSAADALHCQKVAEDLRVPFFVQRVSVAPPNQAAARSARYLALERMAEEAGADKIVTGHTLDDQAETVKLRLERGGFGLGIPPKREKIVRPILRLRRTETEAVCVEAGVRFLNDPSNRDLRYARVRVRADLAKQGDPRRVELARTGAVSASQAGATLSAVEAIWPELVRVEEGELCMRRGGLLTLAPALAGQVLWRAFDELSIQGSGRLVSDILHKVFPANGSRLDLPGGLSIWSEADEVIIGRWLPPPRLPALKLTRGTPTVSLDWGLRFEVDLVPVAADRPAASPWEALIDADAATGALSVRQWAPGDRFHPLGAAGSKKLQDFFVDSKVPRRKRPRVPLVLADDRIAWVAGHRIDERFKLSDSSHNALRLRVTPASV